MTNHGIMYHHLHDNKVHIPSQGSITAEDFLTTLRYYSEKGYHLLPAGEWYEKAMSGHLYENEVCITFDDGLKAQYDIAHTVLQAEGLTAFYFIPTVFLQGGGKNGLEIYRHFRSFQFEDIDDFYQVFFEMLIQGKREFQNNVEKELVEFNPEHYLQAFPFYTDSDKLFRYMRDRVLQEDEYDRLMSKIMDKYGYKPEEHMGDLWMSEQDIRDLHQTGNIIGLHSHNHPTILGTYDYKRQREEYSQNREILKGITGEDIKAVSYPCNSYNPDTIKIMKELGVCLGFRANMETGYSATLECKREDHANIIRRIRDENYRIYQ